MTYDPRWGMPRQHWAQRGSFPIPVAAPTVAPDDGTMVCLPPIAREWIPFILGAMDQLRNPSSWIAADDAARSTILDRVARLREMVGSWGPCVSYELRYTAGCALEYSTDSGATWTEVSGWAANFDPCVYAVAATVPKTTLRYDADCNLQESFDGETWADVPGWDDNFVSCVEAIAKTVITPPYFPPDTPVADEACTTAAYITSQVVEPSIQKAIDVYTTTNYLLNYATSLVLLLPGFDMTALFLKAATVLYGYYTGFTISFFEAAMSDGALWEHIKCAIYRAILADGHLTATNYPAVLTNVASVEYIHPDVVTAIHDYMQQLGWDGLNTLAQGAGVSSGADCSACGGWCQSWDSTTHYKALNVDWYAYQPGGFPPFAVYSGGVWNATPSGTGGAMVLYIRVDVDPTATITQMDISVSTRDTGASEIRFYSGDVGSTVLAHSDNTFWDGSVTGVRTILISPPPATITQITIRGTGSTVSPWGASNCV